MLVVRPVILQINNGKKSKRKLRVVHDILGEGTNSLLSNEVMGPATQWSNGSLRMEAMDIESLYR